MAMTASKYSSSERVLNKALRTAFDGIDMAELEAAWRESMSKVNLKK
jgi:hypothetical protein